MPHTTEIANYLSVRLARTTLMCIASSGWLDDSDEFLLDLIKDHGVIEAKQLAQDISDLIDVCNNVVPQPEQIRNNIMNHYDDALYASNHDQRDWHRPYKRIK